jgi:protein-disulfide isomerase
MRFTTASMLSTLAAVLAVGACNRSDGARAAATTLTAEATNLTTGDTTLEQRADRARIQGNPSAPVWVIEVSDFQCPYCKMWHDQTYPALKREYVDAGKVRLAYINFPIQGHQNAWPAAEAAMCAGAQEKFWPMQDALFNAQSQWENLQNPLPVFDSLATKIGVDLAPFNECVSQQKMRPLIQADYDRARRAGVDATPSFVIGNTLMSGAQPISEFRKAIDEALAKQAKGAQ